MSKERKVKIDMLSVISPIEDGVRGEAERSEVSHEGREEMAADGILLSYSEMTEGGKIRTEIFVGTDTVVVERQGAIGSEMIFREGERSTSLYKIPPYTFDMEIYAKKVRITADELSGRVDLLYEMKVGGDTRAARMRIIWS